MTDPASLPPTRRRRSAAERARRRSSATVAALLAAMVATLAAGVWWYRSENQGSGVEPGTYVAPTDIATNGTSAGNRPTSSTSPRRSSGTRTTGRPRTPSSPGATQGSSTAAGPSTPRSTGTSATSSTKGGSSTGGPSAGTSSGGGSAVAPAGDPTRVQVTSGGRSMVDASLIPTYLDAQKVLAPPFGTAGWYAESGWPKPGHRGASILVGHINHGGQPDVFWNLPQVRVGDTVTVSYASGQQVRFRITRSQASPKTVVPTDDTIWDYDNPRPLLRLITCDPTTPLRGGHYEGNWVVWADELA